MKKLRVCHISTMANWGGVERLLVDLFNEEKEKTNIKHFLVTTSISKEILEELKKIGVEVFEPKRLFHYDPLAILRISIWLRKKKIDIIHTYNLQSNCWGGLAILFNKKIKRISGEHGTVWLPKNILGYLEQYFFKTSDLIVANSNASKIMLIKDRKIIRKKIIVLHNAVKAPVILRSDEIKKLRNEFGLAQDVKVIGTVGRLTASKDLFTWLDIAKKISLRRENIRFLIVGNGPLSKILADYAEELGLFEKLIFTGWRPDARNIMQMFDIYMSTSIHESFGNSLIEAAFCKIPLLAPSVDGIPEYLRDGETGFLVKPDKEIHPQFQRNKVKFIKKVVINNELTDVKSLNPEKMALKALFLLDNLDIKTKMKEQAYKMVIKNYTITRYLEELRDIYTTLGNDENF